MVRYLYCCLIVISSLLIGSSAPAQITSRNFRNFSVAEGLSQSTVYSIVQDTIGFVWMATQEGLNRFDGYTFTVFQPGAKARGAISSSYLRVTFVDSKGQLWVGGDKGISRFNYSDNSFINYRYPHKPGEWFISSIAEDEQKQIWASSYTGELFLVDQRSQRLKPYVLETVASEIRSLNCIRFVGKTMVLGTSDGVYTLNKGSKHLNKLATSKPHQDVNDIFVEGRNLWIATEGNGVLCYNLDNHSQVWLQRNGSSESSLADNNVRAINKDADGNIWIGTFRGLSVYNKAEQTFKNYRYQPGVPYTISQNSVRCIYRDRQHGMWLGTYYGGANYYHDNDIKFNLLNQNMGSLSLNDQVINVIGQDSKGNFWIGTNDHGLDYWDVRKNRIINIAPSNRGNEGLSSGNVKSIAFDIKGRVFAGTHNSGLNILDPATGAIKTFRHDESNEHSITGDMVYALLRDSKHRMWVGTRSGLDLFNESTGLFNHIFLDRAGKRLSSDEITALSEDHTGRIWIGTTNGVNVFYPDNMLFHVYQGSVLSNEIVNCITEDANGRIWVGTRDGLNLYKEGNDSFVSLKSHSDYLSGTIFGILPDESGNLWLSTNKGLVLYNHGSGRVQYFKSNSVLKGNQFNMNAFCKATDGMLLFGGINGISYFYPKAFKQRGFKLNLRFTALEVLNKVIFPGGDDDILSKPIDKTEALELRHDQRQFSVLFNTFNYIAAGRIIYRFKLEGVDEEWRYTESVPRASYSNLPVGTYKLQVEAIGPEGESSAPRTLTVRVLPPWYLSGWFFVVAFIVCLTVAYLVYEAVKERIRNKQQLRMERMERDKLNYINQVKIDFFTNVSHELRTPLTLILAPLEEILSRPLADKHLQKTFKTMMLNARRLYQLVNQLFEFRKAEAGTLKLKVSRAEFINFVHETYSSFRPLAEKNNINFSFVSSETKLSFLFDKDAVGKILFNLLSNAFKYTPEGGEIEVVISCNADSAIVHVTDNGKGIPAAELDRIFDRFYQVNTSEMNLGSGIGLAFAKKLSELHHGSITADSELGKGSSFVLSLPIGDEVYRNDFSVDQAMYDPSFDVEGAAVFSTLRSDGEDDDDPDDAELDPATNEDNSPNPECLLVVDDNQDIVRYLSDAFGRNYKVLSASNGRQALDLLQTEAVDLIISDVMMPELDGLHFCKQVKKNIQTCHIPLILLTAKSEVDQQIKGLEMGADDYVTKPFSFNLLEIKVQNIFRSRRRLREYYSTSREIVPENIAFNTMDEEFLKQAIGIVERNLTNTSFSVDKFSREIGMSRSNLYLKLKAITGESVTDFIKRIRFKKSIELMEQKQYTIAQVAYMSGFNSPSYFSTAFKQYYDCMPTEYIARRDAEQ